MEKENFSLDTIKMLHKLNFNTGAFLSMWVILNIFTESNLIYPIPPFISIFILTVISILYFIYMFKFNLSFFESSDFLSKSFIEDIELLSEKIIKIKNKNGILYKI